MKIKTNYTVILMIVMVLASCKKYPEGPALSLRSKQARVSNDWKMELVLKNGGDITIQYTGINYTEKYDKSGAYSYKSTSSIVGFGSGKWAFQSGKEIIKRNGVSGQSSADLIILKLKESSFWYRIIDGKDTYEFHLIPN